MDKDTGVGGKEGQVQKKKEEKLPPGVTWEGDDESCSEFVLSYNTVRGYVTALVELWGYQVIQGLHTNLHPGDFVPLKVLKIGIVRGQFARSRLKFADRGVGSLRDGYLASQIPDHTHAVWTRCQEESPRNKRSGRRRTSFLATPCSFD